MYQYLYITSLHGRYIDQCIINMDRVRSAFHLNNRITQLDDLHKYVAMHGWC